MINNENKIIQCDNLVKIFKTKEIEVVALQGLDLTINEGELVAIIGKSGSGKSTLLNIIAGLDRPSAGKVEIDGKNLLYFTDKQLIEYNRKTIGFVWQNNARNLIPYLTAIQNVELPMWITNRKGRKERAQELLNIVGLSNKNESRLYELSGGEQQRVAIAIALANNPRILLADEPTGSLDSKTTNKIMELFEKLKNELGITIIIVTHDMQVSKMVKRVVAISDGMIGSEILREDDKYNPIFDNSKFYIDAEEYAIVDRKGRIKIPEELINNLGIRSGEKLKIVKSDVGFEVSKG